MLKRTATASAAALLIGIVFANPAWSQSSEGSLYGRAKGGATVTITSVDSGSTRQSKADPDGSFTFSKLPPGQYRVTSGNVTREVSVAIGSGSEVNLDDAQRIEVTGTRVRSGIDVSSVESNSVFTQEQIRALPVARSVDAVALLAPGTVKGDDFADGLSLPSFGGASIAENGYYINGLDVTNIRTFLSYANLPFDAIAQQQVKTGGYGAEYGRSLGGVISLVTKRGTNEWKGGASVYWEPRALRSKGRDVADKDPDRAGLPFTFNSADREDNKSLVLYAGGPVVKDRLFVFGLVEAKNDTRDVYLQSTSYQRKDTQPNALLKLDWSITDSHLLEFTAITDKTRYKYTDYTSGVDYSPNHDGAGRASDRDGGGKVYALKYTGYLTDDLTVSALAGRVNDKSLQYKPGSSRIEGLDCPVVLDVDTSSIGCWASQGEFPGVGLPDPAIRDEDKRKSFRFDVEYSLGNHAIKAGIDNQKFESSAAGGSFFTGPGKGVYWRYFTVPANGQINGVSGFAPGSQYVRERIRYSTSGVYDVTNSAYYIEDSWKIRKDLMLYGGLRWESFDNKNGDGVSFVKQDRLLAPRLGFSWDVNNDSSLKVFGNAGRYFIPVASNTNIRATRGESYFQNFYTFTSRDPRTQAPLNLSGPIASSTYNPVLSDGRLPNPGTIADTKLDPMNQDEFILGFQKALTKELNVGVKGTYRKINSGMDDFCDHTSVANWIAANVKADYVDNLAQCMLMNPGKDLNILVDLEGDGKLSPVTVPSSALGLAKYQRTYKSLEFSVERPWDGKWSLAASYTWSRSVGTAEGYVQSNLNQEDAGATQDFDFASFTHGAKGRLPNDRTHVIKAYGNYQLNDEWRLGGNLTVASGRPYSCIGFVPPSVPDYDGASAYTSASSYYCIKDPNKPAELVPRGSAGTTSWTSAFDLQVAYIPSWMNKKLTLQVDIFNLFNSQKATELNEVRDYSREASDATVFPLKQSANYLSPTSFQAPRYVRLTARYEF